jgi:hypothetical protein
LLSSICLSRAIAARGVVLFGAATRTVDYFFVGLFSPQLSRREYLGSRLKTLGKRPIKP